MKLVTYENQEIKLNSMLDENLFAKTRYESVISQQGLILTCDSLENHVYHFVPKPFAFTEIKSFSNESETTDSTNAAAPSGGTASSNITAPSGGTASSDITAPSGGTASSNITASSGGTASSDITAPSGGTASSDTAATVFYITKTEGLSDGTKTLLEYFEQAGKKDAALDDKNQMFEAAYAVVCALTQAATEKFAVPQVGGGGILVSLAEEKTQLVFMPETLFASSAAGLSKTEDADNQGCWINSTLRDLPALCFARSALAYKMLTGRYPFPAVALDERNADILDKKFLPMELSVNGIDSELAAEINKGLKLTSSAVLVPGKKQRGKGSEDLTPTAEFPVEKLYSVKNQKLESKLSVKEFEQKAENYEKSQKSKVAAKRAIRRNTTKIIIGAIVLCVLLIIFLNTKNSKAKEFTTKGLTSTEVIQGFFKGINTKDSTLMQNFASGKNPQKMEKVVSQIYVLDKQRRLYNGDNGFASPQNWIYFISDVTKVKHSGVYGATNLKVDDKRVSMDIDLKTMKDNPEAVKEEKGVPLKNGMKSVHQVEYFVLHSEGEDEMLYVDYSTDTFTLTYKKDRWIITDVQSTSEKIPLNNAQFISDYFEILNRTEGDKVRTVQFLCGRYPWLPEADSVQKEIDYQNSENAKMLSSFGL